MPPTQKKTRLTDFVNLAVTEPVRERVNSTTRRMTGLVDRRLSNADVLTAMLDLADENPDRFTELARKAAENKP